MYTNPEKDCPLITRIHANSREKILFGHCCLSIRVYSRHSRANLLLFVFIRVYLWLRHPNYQSEIEKQQRRGEKETIQKVERAADSREQIPRVLDASAALDD